MKNLKENKGITLVALIITIIVLLILAVVAISEVNGDGIISKAKITRKNYQDAQSDENLALAGYLTDIENANSDGNSNNQQDATVKSDVSYVGYYADVDNDGTPDGVIFVDLMDSKNSSKDSLLYFDSYSYTPITTSKEYRVTSSNYTENTNFGEYPIISAKEGTTGNDRFYVMALSDIDSKFCWNKANIQEEYTIEAKTVTELTIASENNIAQGRKNTNILMQSSALTGDTSNLWNHINTEVANGWFVPSRTEWSAFGNYLYEKLGYYIDEEDNCNYNDFGLEYQYWSSSQYLNKNGMSVTNGVKNTKNFVWFVYMSLGCMENCKGTDEYIYTRLATTF